MSNELACLMWLERQARPVWGGHLERGEPCNDPVMLREIEEGIIQAVDRPFKGYVITDKGRAYIRDKMRPRV